jgi:hypothetical protein
MNLNEKGSIIPEKNAMHYYFDVDANPPMKNLTVLYFNYNLTIESLKMHNVSRKLKTGYNATIEFFIRRFRCFA